MNGPAGSWAGRMGAFLDLLRRLFMIAVMKTTFHRCRWLGLVLIGLLLVPSLAQAQIAHMDPAYPRIEEGSAFLVNCVTILFTVLTLLITFKTPKRNAIETDRT